MRVGLLADTHDRLPVIAEFARRFSAAGVGLVLHAGDYCAPFALRPIKEANLALAGVFGRNDGDRDGLLAEATQGLVELYESPHGVVLDDAQILLVHDLGEVSQRSLEAHGVVVHGRLHRQAIETRGDVLLVNPGEACGWLNGVPSAAILDTTTKQVEVLTLHEAEWRT